MELKVDAAITFGALRIVVEEHIAAEESCLLRVITRWYVDLVIGGRKRMMEITEEDVSASLRSLGLEDRSEMLVQGPISDTTEGVGQALAVMNVQWRKQNTEIVSILKQMAAGITEMVSGQREAKERAMLDNTAYSAYLTLEKDEKSSYCHLKSQMLVEGASHGMYAQLMRCTESLVAESRNSLERLCYATFDCRTPAPDIVFEDWYTAARKGSHKTWVTLRALVPLTPTRHRWSVKIISCDEPTHIMLGMLPKLDQEAVKLMKGAYIGSAALGGWCIYGVGPTYGNWKCEPLTFKSGDTIRFDFSFSEMTLTITSNEKSVIGHIQSLNTEEFYPAVSLGHTTNGQKICLQANP